MNNLCFDVGGTSTKYALVKEEKINHLGSIPTPRFNCRETIPSLIVETYNKVAPKQNVAAIGISTAGQINHKTGQVIFATDNLPDYTGTPLKEIIEKRTGVVCQVENDVNAAAIGEMIYGSAVGQENFVLMTLGTGIGGSIVSGGHILRGQRGVAGEIGHMKIEKDGRPCTCGSYGCYEQYASTKALINDYVKASDDQSVTNGFKFMERLQEKDKNAVEVFEDYITYLGMGISNLIHTLDPSSIIIGGGISNEGDNLLIPLRKKLKDLLMPLSYENTKVIAAALTNDAALYGMSYVLDYENK